MAAQAPVGRNAIIHTGYQHRSGNIILFSWQGPFRTISLYFHQGVFNRELKVVNKIGRTAYGHYFPSVFNKGSDLGYGFFSRNAAEHMMVLGRCIALSWRGTPAI